MILNTNLKNIFLVVFTTLILSACSTAKKTGTAGDDAYTEQKQLNTLHRVFLTEYFLLQINLL